MNTKLRQQFAKDYNLPINVFREDLFEYYQHLYDFFPQDVYQTLMANIVVNYKSNVDLWLNHRSEFKENVIQYILTSEKYKDFLKRDMSVYANSISKFGEKSYYTEATNGSMFLSIDLKKANFQALKEAGIIEDETYNDFMGRFTDDNYLIESKYLRQVVFGKLNGGRITTVEKYLMSKVHNLLMQKSFRNTKYLILYSVNVDELVYKIDMDRAAFDKVLIGIAKEELEEFSRVVKKELNLDVRCEIVQVRKLNIVNCHDNKVDAYTRENVITGEAVLKKASTTFYPQIYKLWKGLEIEERDLIFYDNDQLAKFLEPLRIIQ